MKLTSRIGIGLAAGLLALATAGDAKAQAYGGYGYRYATPYYGSVPGFGYGYGAGYGYGRGYPYYGPQAYYVPQTYNNLNGLAGLIGGTVGRRNSYVAPAYRRRRW